jgi:transcriptional regulator GlxA family with amidase domain
VAGLLRAAAARGARVASVCTGAFVLAAAGLLDGRRATTHWEGTAELARRHPAVGVDPGVLYVDNDGRVLTSAGLAAGLDMCLHMVSSDYGAAVAAAAARRVVVPLIRDGGQAQFIEYEKPAHAGPRLSETLAWMEANLHHPLALDDIACHAAMSVRSLTRYFHDQVGMTPMQQLLLLRIQRAKELLETTDLPVERLGDEVGFGSAVALRQQFTRRVGVSPQRYRAAFQARQASR